MVKGKYLKYWVNRHDSKVVYTNYLFTSTNWLNGDIQLIHYETSVIRIFSPSAKSK